MQQMGPEAKIASGGFFLTLDVLVVEESHTRAGELLKNKKRLHLIDDEAMPCSHRPSPKKNCCSDFVVVLQ